MNPIGPLDCIVTRTVTNLRREHHDVCRFITKIPGRIVDECFFQIYINVSNSLNTKASTLQLNMITLHARGLFFNLARLIARNVEIMMRLILSLTHYIILCNIRFGPQRCDLRLQPTRDTSGYRPYIDRVLRIECERYQEFI